jgi:hypothetical protein
MSSPPVSGHGSFEFSNSKYTGEWLNSNPDGQGRMEYPSGTFYVGAFRNGLRHGKGVLTRADGSKYEGDWVDDKKHGKGVYTRTDGAKYEGDYVDDKRHGKGVETCANGDKYDGGYVNGKKNGKGVFMWANGDKFFNGEKFECTFVEGRCPEFDVRQADVRARANAAAKAGAKAVSCHVHEPAAWFKSWDSVFITIGSSRFAFGSNREKAFTRAQEAQQSSLCDDAHKTFALEGCHATAAAEFAGRNHIMAVEYLRDPARPKHYFAFEDRHLRDAFVQRLQVC